MSKDIKKINQRISKFVHEFLLDNNYVLHIERLHHFRSFANILLDNIPFIDEAEYKINLSREDAIKYAYQFLESISKEYGLYLFNKLDKDEIKFISYEDAYKKNLPLCSYSEYKKGKRFINIVLENDISDVYSIIHEVLHDTNIIEDNNPNFNPDTRDYFTETISFLGTTLASIYFDKKYPNIKEFKYDNQSNYYGLYKKAVSMDYALNLIDAYIFNENITNSDIEIIEKDKSEFYLSAADEYLEEILSYSDNEFGVDCLDLLYNESYLLAGILTNYIINKYDSYTEQVNVLKDLNELIMTKDYKSIFNYLDLDVYEKDNWFINLDNKSLDELEICFKEESKRI